MRKQGLSSVHLCGLTPLQMPPQRREEFVIFHVPHAGIVRLCWLLGPHGDVCYHLAKPPFRVAAAHFFEQPDDILTCGGHGSLSFMFAATWLPWSSPRPSDQESAENP